MKREEIKSSMIKSIGYDDMTHTLEVEFSDRAVWQYYDIPKSLYTQIVQSDSIGSYFHKEVKTKSFRCEKVS